jgi:hypothetical protein
MRTFLPAFLPEEGYTDTFWNAAFNRGFNSYTYYKGQNMDDLNLKM